MHHVHEVLSVHGDVTFAADNELNQGDHDLMHLDHEVLSLHVVVTFALIMYLSREFMSSCT